MNEYIWTINTVDGKSYTVKNSYSKYTDFHKYLYGEGNVKTVSIHDLKYADSDPSAGLLITKVAIDSDKIVSVVWA